MTCAIDNLDLSQIENKFIHFFKWPKKNAKLACKQYRNFLKLQKKYGKKTALPPSQCIDEVWHLHILDTKKYKEDCDNFLGYFLDHAPYYPSEQNAVQKTKNAHLIYSDQFNNTKELYFQEFGHHIVSASPLKITIFLKSLFLRF